jgi:2-amino-4-hydroxy-6-hydroxymethyldihydropteridine diphosphokinase
MNLCYLSLGSNQKFPERQIRNALKSIKNLRSTSILKVSNLYWSKAWGLQVQQDFCNVIVEIMTLLPPVLLLNCCKKIEKKQGRIRKKRWGPRTLDIDIILYGTRRMNTKNLSIPHPHMLSRDFVLIPLLEINPQIQLTRPIESITLRKVHAHNLKF